MTWALLLKGLKWIFMQATKRELGKDISTADPFEKDVSSEALDYQISCRRFNRLWHSIERCLE